MATVKDVNLDAREKQAMTQMNPEYPATKCRRVRAGWGVGVVLFAATAVTASNNPYAELLRVIGIMLMLVFVAGRCWCTLFIGGRKDQVLSDIGPYSVMRNPLYLFNSLGLLGMGMMTGSLLMTAVLAVVLIVFYAVFVPREERALHAIFGAAYADYCRRVPRWIPRLAGWRHPEKVTISLRYLYRTFWHAMAGFLWLGWLLLVAWCQEAGWLPVWWLVI